MFRNLDKLYHVWWNLIFFLPLHIKRFNTYPKAMFTEYISTEYILFFVLYGITGVVPFISAIYLLMRRGNAFAPEVTPPLRLRRWAASFFAVSALGHVWWMLLYLYLRNSNYIDDVFSSAVYVAIVMFDYVAMLTTIAGTLLSMLQNRKRSIRPVIVAMIPFVILGILQILFPRTFFIMFAGIYILVLYVLFSLYMVFAVRQYGRWLNDNYADQENKKVWLSQVVSLVFLLLFILYALVDIENITLIYALHVIELVFFCLLLWRVETLPEFADTFTVEEVCISPTKSPTSNLLSQTSNLSSYIEQQLKEHCVDTQIYLQHDLTLQQLAQAIGTNRSYLSQYFSRQGITYNTYINNLRINYFINRYQEAVAARQPIVAQQLASESGYRSYSTFSLAFKQRMGQSVTSWIHNS